MQLNSLKKQYPTLVVALMVSSLVVACSSDSGEASTAGAPADIEIKDFSFGEQVEVAVGTLVSVTNRDATGHTWTSADDAFDSGFLNPGDMYEIVLESSGSFDFFCRIHPSMTGTIAVNG